MRSMPSIQNFFRSSFLTALCAPILFLFIFFPVLSLRGADDTPPSTDGQEAEIEIPRGIDEEESDFDEESESLTDRVVHEISEAVNENSADDLLNLATESKLTAESILDLTKTIAYCIEAEKKGLDEASLEYCRKLKVSAQLERGLALANFFMGDISVRSLPNGWETIRALALEDLNVCLEENQDLSLALLAVGRLEMLPNGDQERARTILDQAIAAQDIDLQVLSEALKFRASLSENGADGLALIDRAIALVPENATNSSYLAVRSELLDRLGRDEEALEVLEQAIAADPQKSDLKKNKAFLLAQLERYDEAEKSFNEATSDTHDELMTLVERAYFLSAVKQNQKAIELLSDIIGRIDHLPLLYMLRAELYTQEKDLRQATRDVNQALRLEPTNQDAIHLKGVIYCQQKKYTEAIRLFELLLKRAPGRPQTVEQLAYAYAQADFYQKAVALLEEALSKDQENVSLLRSYADIQLLYGKYAKAATLYDKILQIEPEESGTLNNYAWLLATAPDDSARNGARALELALKAAELTHYKESHILSTLGAAYAETGDFDHALEWAQKGVELGEKENVDRIEDLRKEPESYQQKKPWRETPEKAGKADENSAQSDSVDISPEEKPSVTETVADEENFF